LLRALEFANGTVTHLQHVETWKHFFDPLTILGRKNENRNRFHSLEQPYFQTQNTILKSERTFKTKTKSSFCSFRVRLDV